MITFRAFSFKTLLAGAFLACAFSGGAVAATDSPTQFDDTTKVAGATLKLNGHGLRTRLLFKVYAAALYLSEKKTSLPEVLKSEGPRRMTLVMMRDISSDDFGQAFMTGLNNNVDKTEKSKFVSQISKFGEMFASIESLKKGDVLHIDWIPAVGTQCELNGKKKGEAVPDLQFYNAVLRIWLGDKPADGTLKTALLGGDAK